MKGKTKVKMKGRMTRMNKIRATAVLSLVLAVAGCDFVDNRAIDRERADSIYRTAMADYSAGRIDEAVAGLERVIAATPSNASARFQLACLLQDAKKDYLGAICHYREFMLLDRSGEKSGLAKDRIGQCERLLGPELVKKLDLGGNATLAEANAGLKEKVAGLEKSNADLQKRLDAAIVRAREAAEEVERMRKMLRGDSVEDTSKPKIDNLAQLLDDEEDDGREDRIKFSKDVAGLIVEEEREKVSTPFEVVDRKSEPVKKATDDEPPHEARPDEYVVQEGDTLYKLAIRFYGRRSAWNKIREANKAVISTDGRIKVGQTIVLP